MNRRLKADPQNERRSALAMMLGICILVGCGEPIFENAGSQRTLLEDREACAAELDRSPGAMAYRENPGAHAEFLDQVFDEMNRCIERKGWKLLRSRQEQEHVREAITSELTQTDPESALMTQSDPASLARRIEQAAARSQGSVR